MKDYRFKLSVTVAIINLTSPQVQELLTRSLRHCPDMWPAWGLHEACDISIVDMMHARLHLACYDQLCRPDVSLGAHSSFLGNLKLRRRNLRWAMSIKSDGANFLTITCGRICLKMNQRSSRQRRSVPRWGGELRRQILKQWVDWLLLSYISLTHLCAQELPEIELVPIVSTTKERTSVEDRVMETSSKAAVRG